MTPTRSAAAPPIPFPLVPARRGRPADDPIFALNQEATARRAKGETIVNATLGTMLGEDGALAVLPTAARAVKEVAAADWAAYAPIAGNGPFLDAVLSDLFGTRPDVLAQATAVATPGGTGALRHAVATFLEPGQALLTTSFHWGPYDTIADEHDRKVATFPMFDRAGAIDAAALDRALTDVVARQGRALVLLNDPCHNPTGYSMDAADWRRVSQVLGSHAARAPVAICLDAAYSAWTPTPGLAAPFEALLPLRDRLLLLVAWSASKTFTHYGLRVGALAAVVPDAADRAQTAAALVYACRGTWSNCNRGGMAAVTRLLRDDAMARSAAAERAALVGVLLERVALFNREARAQGLLYPRYDGGFFTTVFAQDPRAAAARLRSQGVYVVPVEGALRLGLCSVTLAEVPRLVTAVASVL